MTVVMNDEWRQCRLFLLLLFVLLRIETEVQTTLDFAVISIYKLLLDLDIILDFNNNKPSTIFNIINKINT